MKLQHWLVLGTIEYWHEVWKQAGVIPSGWHRDDVKAGGWTLSDAGVMNLVPPGTTANTLQGMVEFEPSEFSLGPGESGHIKVRLTMPAGGPATRWGVLLSEVRPAVPKPAHFGPLAIGELGSTFYLSRVPAEQGARGAGALPSV